MPQKHTKQSRRPVRRGGPRTKRHAERCAQCGQAPSAASVQGRAPNRALLARASRRDLLEFVTVLLGERAALVSALEPKAQCAAPSTTRGPSGRRRLAALLAEGGFDPKPRDLGKDDPVARGVRAYRELIETSLTTAEAAAQLGVNESRIRQRLGGERPDLLGIKVRRGWVLPHFQFQGNGSLVPNIERALSHLPAGLHPLAVSSWFQLPNPDLPEGEGSSRNLSPLEWLALGRDADRVARLATDLAG